MRRAYRSLAKTTLMKNFFGTFVISNPVTGKTCVEYSSSHSIDDMMLQKNKMEQSRKAWNQLSPEDKSKKLTEFIKAIENSRN